MCSCWIFCVAWDNLQWNACLLDGGFVWTFGLDWVAVMGIEVYDVSLFLTGLCGKFEFIELIEAAF